MLEDCDLGAKLGVLILEAFDALEQDAGNVAGAREHAEMVSTGGRLKPR